ncbi:MAG: thioesterase family protein [Vulcanimicrobiaceae bacterium]
MKSNAREGGHTGAGAFAIEKRVRLADTDATGALYFGAYGRIVEIAEVEFLRSLGYGPGVLAGRGIAFTRVHAAFDFFRPVYNDDLLSLRIDVAGIGVHSVRFACEIFRDDALVAEATIVNACVDADRRSISMPGDIADALRARHVER